MDLSPSLAHQVPAEIPQGFSFTIENRGTLDNEQLYMNKSNSRHKAAPAQYT